jgi:putative ABC transport system permease protein
MAEFRRLLNLFRRSQIDREISDEIQSHVDLRTDANLAAGMSPQQARRDALLHFGNPTATREQVTSTDAALGLDGFWRDLRFAVRQLRNSPGFALTVILSLAIGIGANVAVFSSMDAIVLRPIEVPSLDRVATLDEQQRTGGPRGVAMANFLDWMHQSHSFQDMSVRTDADMSLTGAGDAAQIHATLSTASFFRILKTQAILGRVFNDEESQPGRDAVAVLSYGFWKRRFSADPAVLGHRIMLDEREYTIVGILPRPIDFPSGTDVYLPLAPTPAQLANRSDRDYVAIGRLRDGVSLGQAQSEMKIIAQHLAESYPASNRGWSVHFEPLLDRFEGDMTPLYYRLIMGATLFVLLVVCANVANLQLARGVRRRSEIAMRTALGASRTRILRQLLTENVLLAVVGAAGGVGFAGLYLHLILITMPARVARLIPGWYNTSINGRALAFSLVLAVIAGVAAGLVPSLEALRVKVADQLRAGARQSIGGRSRLRNLFAIAQIALAVALVIGAALMAKGMNAMLHQADIYSPDHILTLGINLPLKRYPTADKRAAWFRQSLDRLRALPGVSHVEATSAMPYSDNDWKQNLTIENQSLSTGQIQSAVRLAVSTGYFDSMHIAILDGRSFTQGDSLGSTPVAVVSRRFAQRYLNGANPIGHRIRMGDRDSQEPWVTIVGVVDEARYSLWEENTPPDVYFSVAQIPSNESFIAVFTNNDPLSLAAPARKALASVDPYLPIEPVQTYAKLVRDNMIGLIYAAVMLGIDALIALLLAAIGIFGVMANLVGERTREIGVRLAMGAQRGDVLSMVLRRAIWLTATGISIGLVSAFVLAHMVANLLRGVRSDDPIVFSLVAIVIAAAALGSSWIPAHRASRIDPMEALRAE